MRIHSLKLFFTHVWAIKNNDIATGCLPETLTILLLKLTACFDIAEQE